MDIHNMLNNKGSAAAAAVAAASTADHQLTQQVAHSFAMPNSADAPSDFEVSDHSSELTSRIARPSQILPYQSGQMHHTSQGDIQQPVPLLASSPDVQRIGFENGYAHSPDPSESQRHSGQVLPSANTGGGDAVKAFACGTCSKGFARRSDLARHG